MQNTQQFSDAKWSSAFEAAFLLFRQSMAAVAQVFSHRRMGAKYLNPLRWFTAMCILAGLTECCQSERDFTAMFFLGYAVTFAWLAHRIDIAKRRRAFDLEHSNYNGFPILCDLTGWPEAIIKQWLEPLCVCALGIALGKFAEVPVFGITFVIAGFCMCINRMDQVRAQRAMVEEMYDAELLSTSLAGGFRQLKGAR